MYMYNIITHLIYDNSVFVELEKYFDIRFIHTYKQKLPIKLFSIKKKATKLIELR